MSSHILPKRVYYTIFAILLFCTYLTVQIAFLDLGAMNTVARAFFFFFLMIRPPPRSTLFSYTPLFRSAIVSTRFLFLALALGLVGLVFWISSRAATFHLSTPATMFDVYSSTNGITLWTKPHVV